MQPATRQHHAVITGDLGPKGIAARPCLDQIDGHAQQVGGRYGLVLADGDRTEHPATAQTFGHPCHLDRVKPRAFRQTGDGACPLGPQPFGAVDCQMAKAQPWPRNHLYCGTQARIPVVGDQVLATDRGLGIAKTAPAVDPGLSRLLDHLAASHLTHRKARRQFGPCCQGRNAGA